MRADKILGRIVLQHRACQFFGRQLAIIFCLEGLGRTFGQGSRSAVQRFCAGIGIRPYRPTYRYLRGKPEKQARAKEELADLGNGRRPVNWSC